MNNQELRLELQKQHQTGQQKYTYFLLAASGACIAYATEKSVGSPITGNLILVAAAVVAWASSFFCGCQLIDKVQALIRANASLLALHDGDHESQPSNGELTEAAMRGIRLAIETNMRLAKRLMTLQFRFFVAGGLLFVSWRAGEVIMAAAR